MCLLLFRVLLRKLTTVLCVLALGTYCQQREVEAITEGVEDDDGLSLFFLTPDLMSYDFVYLHIPL